MLSITRSTKNDLQKKSIEFETLCQIQIQSKTINAYASVGFIYMKHTRRPSPRLITKMRARAH